MEKRDRKKHFILILLLVVSFTVSTGCIRNFEEGSNYGITDIEMSADSVKSSYVDLNVTAYIENRGTASEGNTTLLFKAFRQQTGLLEVSEENEVGVIEEGDTVTVSQQIRLPREGSYTLRLDLYEDEQKKASSSITIRNLEAMQTDLQEIGLQISGIDFMVKNVTSGKVLIESDIYLKNEGSKSTENYRMLVKAREMDARLLADKEWTDTGTIEPEATAIRTVSLTVPDDYNYAVEVSIWDDDVIVMTGEDYVQLNPEKVISKEEEVQNKNIQTGDFIVEEGFEEAMPTEETASESASEAAPGFGSLMTAGILLSALLVIRRKSRRGKSE